MPLREREEVQELPPLGGSVKERVDDAFIRRPWVHHPQVPHPGLYQGNPIEVAEIDTVAIVNAFSIAESEGMDGKDDAPLHALYDCPT